MGGFSKVLPLADVEQLFISDDVVLDHIVGNLEGYLRVLDVVELIEMDDSEQDQLSSVSYFNL